MTITLIGAGNIGYHLGKRFYKKGILVRQIFSRNIKNAKLVADELGANAVDRIDLIDSKSDIYIIAVADDSIRLVTKRLSKIKGLEKKLVVHTSGAAASTNLAKYFPRFGVFYPLQSFSKQRKIKFSNIPICVNAGNKKDIKLLKKLGRKTSKKVTYVSDEDRAILHVVAVIVNNFSNHLFYIGQEISQVENIDFELLKPLIQETVLKIAANPPKEMQTGPALRNDQRTIKKHLKYLQKFQDYAHLYALLTKSIQHAHRR